MNVDSLILNLNHLALNTNQIIYVRHCQLQSVSHRQIKQFLVQILISQLPKYNNNFKKQFQTRNQMDQLTDSQSQTFKKRINCKVHKKQSIFICYEDIQKGIMICPKCITSQKFDQSKVVLIEDIEKAQIDDILIDNWPIWEESTRMEAQTQLNQIFLSSETFCHELNNNISLFFNNLKDEINSALTNQYKLMMMYASHFNNLGSKLVDVYKQQCESNILHEKIYSEDESEIQKFLQKKQDEKVDNTIDIMKAINEYNKKLSIVNEKIPIICKSKIFGLVQKINFFSGLDVPSIFEQSDITHFIEAQKKKQKNLSDVCLGLIGNQSNFCKGAFISGLQKELEEWSVISDFKLDDVQICRDKLSPIDFSKVSKRFLIELRNIINNQQSSNSMTEKITPSEITLQLNAIALLSKKIHIHPNRFGFVESLLENFKLFEMQQINDLKIMQVYSFNNRECKFLQVGLMNETSNYFSNMILNNQSNYLIRYKLTNRKNFQFKIGLINHSTNSNNMYDISIFQDSGQNTHFTKVVIGELLANSEIEPAMFEMRINISKQYFLIADYPYYKNVNEILNPCSIDPAAKYRIGFYLRHQVSYNGVIQIIHFDTVDQFDTQLG